MASPRSAARFAALVFGIALIGCDRQSEPKVPGTSSPPRSGVSPEAEAVERLQTDCPARDEDERLAAGLVLLLPSPDARTAQFALDSLRLRRQTATRLLACYIRDATPMQTRSVYWLSGGRNFELFAHYTPETVGDAVALVLGDPPGRIAVCSLANGGSQDERTACANAWGQHLRTAP